MTVRLGLSSIQMGADARRPIAWLIRLQSSSLNRPVRTRAESMRASPQSSRCDSSRLPISRLNTSTGWLAYNAAWAAMPRANDVLCTNMSAATKLCHSGTVRS